MALIRPLPQPPRTLISEQITAAAGGKNLAFDVYVMYGSIETADNRKGTPTEKLIIGRLTYKSRKVAISADQKVPTTRNFKSWNGTNQTLDKLDCK